MYLRRVFFSQILNGLVDASFPVRSSSVGVVNRSLHMGKLHPVEVLTLCRTQTTFGLIGTAGLVSFHCLRAIKLIPLFLLGGSQFPSLATLVAEAPQNRTYIYADRHLVCYSFSLIIISILPSHFLCIFRHALIHYQGPRRCGPGRCCRSGPALGSGHPDKLRSC